MTSSVRKIPLIVGARFIMEIKQFNQGLRAIYAIVSEATEIKCDVNGSDIKWILD